MVEGYILLLDATPRIRSPSKAGGGAQGIKRAWLICTQNVQARSAHGADLIERVIIELGPFNNRANHQNTLDWNEESTESYTRGPNQSAQESARIVP